MDKGKKFFQMVMPIKASINRASQMEKVDISGKMEVFIKVNFSEVCAKVKEFGSIQPRQNIKVLKYLY